MLGEGGWSGEAAAVYLRLGRLSSGRAPAGSSGSWLLLRAMQAWEGGGGGGAGEAAAGAGGCPAEGGS